MNHDADTQPASDMIALDVAARLLMISARRVRQLASDGYITIPKRGHTTIVSAVQGYIRFLKETAQKETKTAAVSRATDARANEIELRIAERRRELIPIEDAILAQDIIVGLVNKELDGQAARVTRDMTLRRLIEADVHAAKTRIADALDQSKRAARTGIFDDATGGAD